MTLYSGPTTAFIGGTTHDAALGDHFPVDDPATGEVLSFLTNSTIEDARAAAASAAAAFPEWASRAPRDRAEVLRASFETMIAHRDELAALIVAENGKPMRDALSEVDYSAEFFRWFSEEASRVGGSMRRSPSGLRRIIELSKPVGVVLAITPWNLPAAMVTRKLAPALAAGCTVVVKPSNQTPLTALRIAQLLTEAGVPDGAVNVVPTLRDKELVADLIKQGPVRMVSFTGSTRVGSQLIAQASERVLNVGMELGGNAPFIVFDDADMSRAIDAAMIAKMRHNAEACTAANRFYVHERVRQEFTERLASAMDGLRMGPGNQPSTEVGPLASAQARDDLELTVAAALDNGAQRATRRHTPKERGYYFAPTVLTAVDPHAEVLEQELFGPVAPIVSFIDEEEVIQYANDSESGLGSYVFSRDLERALRVSEQLDTGMVGVNTGIFSDPAAPFGGTKSSGIGREGGFHGIHEFLETQYLAVDW